MHIFSSHVTTQKIHKDCYRSMRFVSTTTNKNYCKIAVTCTSQQKCFLLIAAFSKETVSWDCRSLWQFLTRVHAPECYFPFFYLIETFELPVDSMVKNCPYKRLHCGLRETVLNYLTAVTKIRQWAAGWISTKGRYSDILLTFCFWTSVAVKVWSRFTTPTPNSCRDLLNPCEYKQVWSYIQPSIAKSKKHEICTQKNFCKARGQFLYVFFGQPFGLDFCVLYSTLLHLSAFRFLYVERCWDWTQNYCGFDIDNKTLKRLG